MVGFYWLYLGSLKLQDYTIYYVIDVLIACAAGFIPQFSANTNRPFHIVNLFFWLTLKMLGIMVLALAGIGIIFVFVALKYRF